MSAPLSNTQKAHLAMLAEEAFKAHPPQVGGPADGMELEEWRHNQVAAACGKFGLRCCTQSDYKLVEAHFLRLLGRQRQADTAYIAAATEPRRQVEARLMSALAQYRFSIGYAEAICRKVYKCTVGEVGNEQLGKLVRIIHRNGTNRGKKRDQSDQSNPSDQTEHGKKIFYMNP